MDPILLKAGESQVFQCTFEDIEGFKGYKDNVVTYGIVNKEFRWSDDDDPDWSRKVWSYWSELNKSNLQNVELPAHSKIYFECKYTMNNGVQINAAIYEVCIIPKYSDTAKEIKDSAAILEAIRQKESSGEILDITPSSFNPYNVGQGSVLYNQLSNYVSNMFGHDSPYFRATPVDKSGDVIFKEWTLYNVDDPKCIKILLNNNEMPDLNLQFNTFGIEYTSPFEVEVLKSEFQEKFGPDAVPQKGDIVYIPLISTRLFEVSSSTPNRGFMYQEISWKLNLTIYKPKSNRDLSEKTLSILDNAIKNPIFNDKDQSDEGLFGEALEKTEKDLTVPQQLNPTVGTTKDPMRSRVSNLLAINGIDLDNHGVKVANYYYDLSSMLDENGNVFVNKSTNKEEKYAVIYDKFQNFKPKQDFAFTSWLSLNNVNVKQESLVKSIKKTEEYYTIISDKTLSLKPNDYVSVERQGRLNFYGKVIAINEKNITVELTSQMVDALENVSQNWANATGYTIKKTIPVNLLHGYNDDTKEGIKLELFCDRFFVFYQNDNQFIFSLKEKLNKDKWYSLCMNYSMKFNQVALSLFDIKTESGVTNSELNKIDTIVKNIKSAEISLTDIQFVLLPSYHKQTNIRIYSETIPEDKQSTILNQYVISDASKAILVDNAIPMNHLPYLGNIK